MPPDPTATPERIVELERVEFGWWVHGHLPKAAVVQHFHDEEYLTITEADVKHAYQRFLPIRGEPSAEIEFDGKYTYDEMRNGYWYDCEAGRGASPYTFVDEWDARHYCVPLKDMKHA